MPPPGYHRSRIFFVSLSLFSLNLVSDGNQNNRDFLLRQSYPALFLKSLLFSFSANQSPCKNCSLSRSLSVTLTGALFLSLLSSFYTFLSLFSAKLKNS